MKSLSEQVRCLGSHVGYMIEVDCCEEWNILQRTRENVGRHERTKLTIFRKLAEF